MKPCGGRCLNGCALRHVRFSGDGPWPRYARKITNRVTSAGCQANDAGLDWRS